MSIQNKQLRKDLIIIMRLMIVFAVFGIITLIGVYKKSRVVKCELTAIQYYNITSDSTVEVRPCLDFYEDITHLIIPSSVTHNDSIFYVVGIADQAFERCQRLKEVVLPESISSIGKYAFSSCYDLVKINIPKGVTTIKAGAFSRCKSLQSIELPDHLSCIPNSLFQSSGIKRIDIPIGVVEIGVYAFAHCDSLTAIHIPNTVTTLGHTVFAHCSSLRYIEIPNSVTVIPALAFYRCRYLRDVKLPNSITHIESSAFESCALQTIDIPNSVISIESDAFALNYYLDSIFIPISVTHIDYFAFDPDKYGHGSQVFDPFKSEPKIVYEGTKEQWSQIYEDIGLGDPTNGLDIHCADGVIEATSHSDE